MMLFSLLTWWYTAGWGSLTERAGRRIRTTLETFSVSLLLGSLFEPFKQISAGTVRGGLSAQMHAFGDRLFSRVFGAVVRSLFIVMGIIGAAIIAVIGLVQVVVWPLVPFLPLIGGLLALTGWTP